MGDTRGGNKAALYQKVCSGVAEAHPRNEHIPTKLLPDENSHKREATYHYLVEWGFLSIPDNSVDTDIAEQLRHAKVTDLGIELIERDTADKTAKSNKSISVNAGVVSASYGVTQPSNKY